MSKTLTGIGLLLLLPVAAVAVEPVTLVVWAPGYPGTTEEAQETMDDFVRGLTEIGSWHPDALRAEYHPTLAGGEAALERPRTGLALVPAAVWHEYARRFRLRALAQAIPETGVEERWSLVAAAGRVEGPASLDGWELVAAPGYAPEFVRGPVLGEWGELPESTRIRFSSRVRSALRRAAEGEDVAVLLDGPQVAALGALPFGAELEIVTRSRLLPASYLCAVQERIRGGEAERITALFLSLAEEESGAELLALLRLEGFREVDWDDLAALRGVSLP